MNYKCALGKWAEDYAELYVQKMLHMRVIGRNIKNKYGELDIAAIEPVNYSYDDLGGKFKLENIIKQKQRAKLEDELVIIEVRCRSKGSWQRPLESVSDKKLRCLVRAGYAYAEKINWTGNRRIDLIGIEVPRLYGERPYCFDYVQDITAGIDEEKFLRF